MPFRGFDRPGDRQKLYPNQIYTDEYTRALYIEDPQHPYTTPPDQPYTWVRSRCVGGKILHWSRNARRLSNFDFKAADRDGYGENWPITYEELAPFYDKVESLHRRSRLDREHSTPSGWQVSAALRPELRRADRTETGSWHGVGHAGDSQASGAAFPECEWPGCLSLLRKLRPRLRRRSFLELYLRYSSGRRPKPDDSRSAATLLCGRFGWMRTGSPGAFCFSIVAVKSPMKPRAA